MTGLYRVFDAAYPPAAPPPGCQGVLGYIGGRRATNVWTPRQWQPFAGLRQFPCYVPDTTAELGETAGNQACDEMAALGWAPYQADRRVVVADLETEIVAGWYQAFASAVYARGYLAVAYGSLSTVLENAADDVWAAAWDGSATLLAGQTIHAHQYAAGPEVDFSVVDEWLFDRGGEGPRHG